MSSSTHFAANLRRLREQRGLTQTALAEAAGLERMTVYQYEAEKRRAKLGDSLDTIAQALGVQPWELLVPPGTDLKKPSIEDALAVIAGAHGYGLTKVAT